MNKEESDLIIAEQNKSTEEILKAVAKFKSDYHKLCELKDIRIEQLEKDVKSLGERCNQLLADKGKLTDECKELKAQNEKMKRCIICKHYSSISGCSYHSNWVKDCKENGMRLFELKEIKENE